LVNKFYGQALFMAITGFEAYLRAVLQIKWMETKAKRAQTSTAGFSFQLQKEKPAV